MLFGVNIICRDDHNAIVPRHRKPFLNVFLAAAHMLGWDVGPDEERCVVEGVKHKEQG